MRSIRMEETRFPLIMEDGKVAECEALLLVESSCGTKNYLVYTDNSIGDDGSLTVFASAYRANAEAPNSMPLRETELLPITTKDEWEFLEAALDSAIRQ